MIGIYETNIWYGDVNMRDIWYMIPIYDIWYMIRIYEMDMRQIRIHQNVKVIYEADLWYMRQIYGTYIQYGYTGGIYERNIWYGYTRQIRKHQNRSCWSMTRIYRGVELAEAAAVIGSYNNIHQAGQIHKKYIQIIYKNYTNNKQIIYK